VLVFASAIVTTPAVALDALKIVVSTPMRSTAPSAATPSRAFSNPRQLNWHSPGLETGHSPAKY
jgi:hypothetical protein